MSDTGVPSTSIPPSGMGKKSVLPTAAPNVPVHAEDVPSFLERIGLSSNAGLSKEDAARHLTESGLNKLPDPPRKSALRSILEQVANPLVLTLLAAAVIAVVVGVTANSEGSFLTRFGDAIAILLIVVLNALLGYYQERRAEAALDALQKLTAPSARVRRDGKRMNLIFVSALVKKGLKVGSMMGKCQ